MEPTRELRVAPDQAGSRLDALLCQELGLSRREVARLLGRGRVTIPERRGEAVRKGLILRAGERVCVLPYRAPADGPLPDAGITLPVLSEAGGLIALDKPAGVATHPLDPEETGTALNAVVARHPEIVGVGEGGVRSGIVHRLDRDTSGVLLVALQEAGWKRARRAFREGRVQKRYVARVHGILGEPTEIRLKLVSRGPRARVVSTGGRETHTPLRPLSHGRYSSLIEAQPTTGHMHQIRATLAHLGHPIVGDSLYGSSVPIGRHLLHATDLCLDDFSAHSDPPDDFGWDEA